MSLTELVDKLKSLNIKIDVKGEKLLCHLPGKNFVIPASVQGAIKENKSSLIEYVQSIKNSSTAGILTLSREEGQAIPLSFGQQGLWFINQYENRNEKTYNTPVALRFQGPLNKQFLQLAFNEIINRHESLRTVFLVQNGKPVQIVQQSLSVEINQENLDDSGVDQQMARYIDHVFNLETGPLIDLKLIRVSENDCILLINLHHIIFDGWSMNVMLNELAAIYKARVFQEEHKLSILKMQYADYTLWQHAWLKSEDYKKQLDYWCEAMQGAPKVMELNTDRPRPDVRSSTGSFEVTVIPRGVIETLKVLGRDQELSLFMVLIAGLNILLSLYSGQTDIVIGTSVANRKRKAFEELIGYFVNTLVIRGRFSTADTVRSLLAHIKNVVMEAYSHQDLPFDKLVEVLNPSRDTRYAPICQVYFVLQNILFEEMTVEDMHISRMDIEQSAGTARFDLHFEIIETNKDAYLRCEYSTDIFDSETIRRMLDDYLCILKNISNTIDQQLSDCVQNTAQVKYSPSVVVAGNFTVDPLLDSLKFWSLKTKLPIRTNIAPYDQLFQQLLASDSMLSKNDGINILLVRFDDWLGQGSELGEYRHLIKTISEFVKVLCAAAARHSTQYLLSCCVSDISQSVHADLEQKLQQEVESIANIHLLGWNEIASLYPVIDYYDVGSHKSAHIPYTLPYYAALGTGLFRRLHGFYQSPYKVLVLDCDNTLWDGVCAEEGPLGVRISEPFKQLQMFMYQCYKKGFLLCLCSRNQAEDVWAVFEQNKDMVLSKDHIISTKINWAAKSKNIKELSEELNLGLESFIFLDDDPVQCADVTANTPEVLVLELPKNQTDIPLFLKHIWALDKDKSSVSGAERSRQYREQQKRQLVSEQSPSMADFIQSLALQIVINDIHAEDYSRAAELLLRTNQFNFNGERYTEPELIQALQSHIFDARLVKLKDRFGDYGTVGLIIYKMVDKQVEVINMILSCRALARGVEYEMLRDLANVADEAGLESVSVSYIRSARNQPAYDFLRTIDQGAYEEGGVLHYKFKTTYLLKLKFEDSPLDKLAEAGNAKSTIKPVAGSRNGGDIHYEIATELNNINVVFEQIKAREVSQQQSIRRPYVTPNTNVEVELATLWSDVLNVSMNNIGRDDDFFALGGHSLIATQLISRIQKLFGIEMSLRQVFEHSLLGGMASCIEALVYIEDSKKQAFSSSMNNNQEFEEFEI